MRIRNKIIVLFSVSLLFLFLVLAFTIGILTGDLLKNSIDDELKNLTKSIMITIKSNVNISVKNYLRSIAENNTTMINYVAKTGNKKQVYNKLRNVLLSQRIGKTGYIYVLDISKAPKKIPVVFHPLIEGRDVGKVGFVRKAAKIKQGYIEYEWKNPGEKRKRKKAMYISYVKKFKWLVCASSYKNEFLNLINKNDFREDLLKLKIGKDGYPTVMDHKGNMIIHPKIEGQNIYNTKDDNGKYFAREVIRKKTGKIIYTWKNPGESSARDKVGYYDYVPSMKWYIWLTAYKDEIYGEVRKITQYLIMIFIIAILLGIPVNWFFTTRITKPLNTIKTRTDLLSKGHGDLTQQITVKSNDETAELSSSFNSFINLVKNIVIDIKSNSIDVSDAVKILNDLFDQSGKTVELFIDNTKTISTSAIRHEASVEEVVTAMTQIKENISSLSNNVNNQSITIEEFSSTIEQMMAQIQNVAGVTEKGKKVTEKLTDAAKKGAEVIQNVLEGVREIEVSSNQIKDIMGVIMSIAEQTNLLAMNAAIEAAHAGDYGKGFAVVADEIRKLAENSASSSKEITGLIQDILAKINNTANYAGESEESLRLIVSDVNTTNNINEEIYNSAQEQSSGASEILTAVQSINEITAQIKTAVNGIKGGSEDVVNTVFSLKEVTENISNSTKEQTSGAQNILDSVNAKKKFIHQIQESMNKMENCINKFKVGEDSKNLTEVKKV